MSDTGAVSGPGLRCRDSARVGWVSSCRRAARDWNGQQADAGRVLRIERRANVRDATTRDERLAVRRRQPDLLILDLVLHGYGGHCISPMTQIERRRDAMKSAAVHVSSHAKTTKLSNQEVRCSQFGSDAARAGPVVEPLRLLPEAKRVAGYREGCVAGSEHDGRVTTTLARPTHSVCGARPDPNCNVPPTVYSDPACMRATALASR